MHPTHFPRLHSNGRLLAPAMTTLAILLMAAMPVTAEPQSDVLEEVQAMLEAEMSEPIIVQWLEGSDRKPRRPSASELIALKQAGASDELLAKLLELAGETAGVSQPAAPAAATKPTTTATAPAAVERPTAVAPAPAIETPVARTPAETSESATGEVPVYFEVTYLPDFDDEEEWWLYLYVDGKPLTYVPAGSIVEAKTLRFREYFPPGVHTLRVAQEQHVERKRGGWSHAARVSELVLPLTLEPVERVDVQLKFRQTRFNLGLSEGPISYRLVQGRYVKTIDKQGGDPEDWPLVCEEIEANAEDGKLNRSLRSLLDDCTRWPDLWPGLEVPPRDEVREALEMFLYRPIPKDQPLD